MNPRAFRRLVDFFIPLSILPPKVYFEQKRLKFVKNNQINKNVISNESIRVGYSRNE